jgi:hypothetical protein
MPFRPSYNGRQGGYLMKVKGAALGRVAMRAKLVTCGKAHGS